MTPSSLFYSSSVLENWVVTKYGTYRSGQQVKLYMGDAGHCCITDFARHVVPTIVWKVDLQDGHVKDM
jgi:hypothetical protein